MNKYMRLVAVTMSGLLFVGSTVAGQLDFSKDIHKLVNDPQITVTGKVVEVKDKTGNATAVKITSKTGITYLVVLDVLGKEIGEKMAGKLVKATGALHIKGDDEWLTIQKYTEYKETQKTL